MTVMFDVESFLMTLSTASASPKSTVFKHFMRAAQRGAWCGFARVVPLAPASMAGERSLDTATRGK